MPQDEALVELTDDALSAEIRRISTEIDGAPPGDERDAARRTLAAYAAERTRRQRDELIAALRSGPTVLMPSLADGYPAPRDPELHDKRRLILEAWARELGLPFGLLPGVDLSDDDVYDEIQTDFYSFAKHLEALKERQRQAGGRLAGMGSAERVMEAFRRAIDSGRLDDAVLEQLKSLLSPEALKWLPLMIGLGAGLGLLGGGWAILGGLILAYGPSVYDLASAIYHIVYAETEEEFAAAVEELEAFLGGVGADILISLASFGLGKGFRYLRKGKAAKAAGPASGRPRRRPGTAGAPERPPRRFAPRPRTGVGLPPSAPRVRPPWLEPPPSTASPRRARPRRLDGKLSREAAAMDPPLYPRPNILSEERFDWPSNRRRFKEQGDAEIITGQTGGYRGVTSPEGRIIISDKLRDGEELLRVTRHELGHRKLRPAHLPEPARRLLGIRIGRLLETAHIIKALDEIFAFASEGGAVDLRRFRQAFADFLGHAPGAQHTRRQYGVRHRRALREWSMLRRQPWFRLIHGQAETFLRMIEEGTLDLEPLVSRLEEFLRRFEEYREIRGARPGGERLHPRE